MTNAAKIAKLSGKMRLNLRFCLLQFRKGPAAGLNADIHADAEYRAHLVTVMAKKAVAAAILSS